MRINNQKIVSIITILLIVTCLALIGCSNNNASTGTTDNNEICPDTLIIVEEATFSSAIDESGRPIGSSNVFQSSTPEIYCTFMVPDVCCSIVVIDWLYQGDLIHKWQGVGPGTGIPLNSSITQPSGGFNPGDYQVILYINVREVTIAYFTIV